MIIDVSETIQKETKELKGGFLGMLLGTLGTSLLGNLLTAKGVKTKIFANKANIPGQGVIRAGKWAIRAGQDFNAASSFK